jgi:phytoene dehydrogenase-like protein
MSYPAPASPLVQRARARAPIPESVDVAIVGCGLGGLVTAAYLAQRGQKVACFDSHSVAGGCATMFARGNESGRYHFDVGLHYIGDCGPEGLIPSILRDLGVHLDYVPLDPDGFDVLVFPGLEFRVPANRELFRDRLVQAFPAEKKGIDRYVDFLRQVDEIGGRVERNRGKVSASIAVRTLLQGRKVLRYQNATIAQVLDDCTSDPGLRAVLLGQNGDYGLPPSEVSALLHAGLVNHYLKGAFYPRGGGQVIADRLAERVEALGGTIHLRRGISKILVEGGRAVGVRTEGKRGDEREVRAKVVVSNADLKRTYTELLGPEHAPAAALSRARELEMAAAIFITFLGVEADMRAKGMGACNYWQFDHFDMEAFYQRQREAAVPDPKVAYITSASLKEPGNPHHAPPGVTSVEVMTILPGKADKWGFRDADALGWDYKRNEDYQALKRAVEDNLIDRLERLFPGTREHIVFRESATPLTHTRYTRASDGSGYGIACTPEQFMQKRPGYRSAVPGLYLCGASTRSGHGIVGTMLSGRAASHTILKDLG